MAGLMKDSRPLVQFVYEMQVEVYPLSIDADLFKSLQAESILIIRSTTNTSTTTATMRMNTSRDPTT